MTTAATAGGVARAVLSAAVGVLVVAAAALLAVVVTVRARRRVRAARDLALAARPRRLVYALVVDDEPDPVHADALVALDRRTWTAVEPTVLGLLDKLRGSARGAFVDVLVRRGGVGDALRRTRDRRPVARAHAAQLLGTVGGRDAGTALDHLLGDPDPDVRAAATRGLGRVAAPTAAFGLVTRLGGRPVAHAPDHLVAHALIRVGEPATNPLRAAAHDARPGVRATAVGVLGHLRAVPAVDDLLTALAHDPAVAVRVRAAEALGAVGSPRALPALAAATDRSRPVGLRVAATVALGRIGAAGSVADLTVLVGDHEHGVARRAAAGLAGLGAAGIEALSVLAGDRSRPRVRAYAREALAAIELPRPPEVPPPGAGAPTTLPRPATGAGGLRAAS